MGFLVTSVLLACRRNGRAAVSFALRFLPRPAMLSERSDVRKVPMKLLLISMTNLWPSMLRPQKPDSCSYAPFAKAFFPSDTYSPATPLRNGTLSKRRSLHRYYLSRHTWFFQSSGVEMLLAHHGETHACRGSGAGAGGILNPIPALSTNYYKSVPQLGSTPTSLP